MTSEPPVPSREPAPDPSPSGRDEMNLAEFPLALLTDRAPRGQKTLQYVGQHGQLTITGSDAHGLPTAADTDVLIGLIQLTRLRNNFTDPKVHFTRYEMLKLLRWPDEGPYYRRLDESLNRWMGVTLHYDNTWWDNRTKRYLSAKLHILESVIIDDQTPRRRGRDRLPGSWFCWNQTFIASCQADNLKRLDLERYFGFRGAITKRVYRFLDKRFYLRPEWTFALKEFAFEHVGLSRSYAQNAGKIKEKLQGALAELEEAGFLEPLAKDKRYRKEGRDWTIRLARRQAPPGGAEAEDLPGPIDPPPSEAEAPPLARELIARGVTPATAVQLVQAHPPGRIEAKLEAFDWLLGRRDKRLRTSPAGYLVKSIQDDYAPPPGFETRAARAAREAAAHEARGRDQEHRRLQAEEAARAESEQAAILGYWDSLTPAEQAALDEQALAAADPETLRGGWQRSALAALYRKTLRHDHIQRLLQDRDRERFRLES